MTVLYAMPGNEDFARLLAQRLGWTQLPLQLHRFPDGESLVRIEPPTGHPRVVIVCTLDRADTKVVPLLMAAATARELGASRVDLVAPYLAYMRQDSRFHPGEAVSARIFGQWLGQAFDGLVTVDPHLHRYRSLDEVYPLEAHVVHAAPAVAAWIREHVPQPLLVGPDGESGQWVRDVAAQLDVPCVVATKQRAGDRQVRVSLPGIEAWRDHTPVVLDDIISSGHTMIDALRCLRESGARAPVCIGVHGVFAEGAREGLLAAGAQRIVTSNTIAGDTALLDISTQVAAALEPANVPRAAPAQRQSA